MSVKIFSLIILGIIFLLIIELIRRERLTFKYAFGWISALLVGLVIVFTQPLFQKVAAVFGFALLSNFIFFCCMGIAVILGLLLTVLLCRQDQRNEVMAKKIAMLENEIRNSNLEIRRKSEA